MFSSQRGFTLIELLVVIVVISIFFSLAVVSFTSTDGSEIVEEEGRRFRALIGLAKEKSLFENIDLGLFFYRGGYGFVVPVRTEDPNDPDKKITQYFNAATELDDKTFRLRKLPKNTQLTLLINDNEVAIPDEWPEDDSKRIAQTMLFSSGESNPFKLVISFDDKVTQILSINELGKTTITPLAYDE